MLLFGIGKYNQKNLDSKSPIPKKELVIIIYLKL